MIQLTYGQVKGQIAEVCGTSGMPVTDVRVMRQLNNAIQELSCEGAFPGVVDRWHIKAVDGRIVLPANLDMLLEFTAAGIPQQLVSSWSEFVNYGPGIQEDLLHRGRQWSGCGCYGNVYDRGEHPTYADIPVSNGSSCVCTDGTGAELDGPWVLRQYANPSTNETPDAYSTIQGLDPAGLVIRSSLTDGSGNVSWINGVRLGITSGSGFTETTQEFSEVTAYTKPVTNGYVRLTAWNGVTEVELSNYQHWETTPSYHRYFSPFLQGRRTAENPCCRVILARARRRFVPVSEDTDVLMISNINALKAMVIALWKRDAGAYDEYLLLKTTAVDIMKKEAMAYRGKVRAPALTFQRGFSVGELPSIR